MRSFSRRVGSHLTAQRAAREGCVARETLYGRQITLKDTMTSLLGRTRAPIALALLLGAVLVPAGVAQATPPTLTAVSQSAQKLSATWTLPPAMVADFIEVASSPAVESDGYFPNKSTVMYDPNIGDFQTSYVSLLQFPAGTYYVHVAAFSTMKCRTGDEPDCVDEFSPIVAFTVPVGEDKITAFAAVGVRPKQRIGKLYVEASMLERGTISAGGTVSVPNSSKVFKFKTASAKVDAGVGAKLRLKLSRKALATVKRALKRHRKLKARITITAKDIAGNVAIVKRTVKLKP
jgi:hypothetical protein